MQPHKRWWKAAGYDVKMIHSTSLLGRSSVVILDKEIVKNILTAPAGKGTPRFHRQSDFLRNTLGDGLVTLEGDDWTRHRRILQPAFHANFVKESLNAAVPPKVSKLIRCWSLASESGREIDAASHLSALTLDIIGEVAFSHEFHGLRVVEEWSKANDGDIRLAKLDDPFISSLLSSLKPNRMTMILLLLGMAKLDVLINYKHRRMCKMLNQAVDQVIANARQTSNTNTKSLLQLMLVAQDPEDSTTRTKNKGRGLNEIELRDETKTFLLAGHETTSTWVYWAIYALAKHPDVQERLYEDIIKHAPSPVAEIELNHVEKMEYLKMFLQEVLRLYPPVGMIVRLNTYPETFAGYEIPAETRLVIPPHLLHRHPHYWDDPETFRPERWLNVTNEERERRRFAFLPFSAGSRNCIGQRFATIEAQLIVAPLIRAFRVQVAPSQRDTDFTFTSFITMKTRPDLNIVVQKR